MGTREEFWHDGYLESWYDDGSHGYLYIDDDKVIHGSAIGEWFWSGVETARQKNCTVRAGDGNDTIQGLRGFHVYGEDGNDIIEDEAAAVVFGGFGNDSLKGSWVDGGPNNDIIEAIAVASGGDGNDTILGSFANSYESNNFMGIGGNGNDTFKGYFYGKVVLEGGRGNDSFDLEVKSLGKLDGGAGNDFISVKVNFASDSGWELIGGEGNDTIQCVLDRTDVTIEGGTGDDIIDLTPSSRKKGALIKYYEGDGHDVIYGASSALDKLYIEASYEMTYTQTTEQSNRGVADLIFKMSDGSVTFKDLSVSEYMQHPLAVASDDGDDTPIAFVYGGGDKAIPNYSGGKVAYATDFTGIGFNDNDFMINSSSGTLSLQNARDKVIDVSSTRGRTIAYAFMASGGGEIDGSGFPQMEVILGGNNASNVIYAGAGGSSLWGGADSVADTLNGGFGEDNFFVGKKDGSDVINFASPDDRVILYDVSLSDISSFTPSELGISLALKTGSTITVNDTDNLSPAFQLSDGSSWKFNHTTNDWQSA